jgi:putative membrane protein
MPEALFSMVAGFLWLGFWVAVIYLLVKAVDRGGPRRGDAISILEERYARGEIAREEYAERRAVLEQHRHPAP